MSDQANNNPSVQNGWVGETLHNDISFTFKVDKVLYEQKTEEWHLLLIENPQFGKVLMLDGITQVTSRDEFVYHEMMSHVPIFAHGNAREVLIVGGGDCGMAEEALKHKSINRLTQVEIDQSVVDFSKEHFSDFNAAVFIDPRFDLIIGDGAQFMAETDRKFDVIMVDSTDPIGPGAVLFTEEFYRHCYNHLTPGGILVTQSGVPFFQADEIITSVKHFSKMFKDASAYIAAIPTYIGGHMALGWASDEAGHRTIALQELETRFAASGIQTRYYTPEVHRAAFALPKFIKDAVEQGLA